MLPYRKNIRLQGYDYSSDGLYFITICTNNRRLLFGSIKDWRMTLNDNGKIVLDCWNDLPNHYDNVILHDFCIMPNHIHGIIQLRNGLAGLKPATTARPLSEIVRALKTFSSRKINERNGTQGCPLWQRNYYEHIIRSDSAYTTISEYIKANPQRWADDKFYYKENY